MSMSYDCCARHRHRLPPSSCNSSPCHEYSTEYTAPSRVQVNEWMNVYDMWFLTSAKARLSRAKTVKIENVLSILCWICIPTIHTDAPARTHIRGRAREHILPSETWWLQVWIIITCITESQPSGDNHHTHIIFVARSFVWLFFCVQGTVYTSTHSLRLRWPSPIFAISETISTLMYWHENLYHYRKYSEERGTPNNGIRFAFTTETINTRAAAQSPMRWRNRPNAVISQLANSSLPPPSP